MTVLRGPCFSLAARGTLASTITYTAVRNRPVLKRRSRRHNPDTIEQKAHRNMLRYLTKAWGIAIPPAKASWTTNLPEGEHSAYHWYVKINMERWRRGRAPTWWYPNFETGTPAVILNWSLTAVQNYVRLHINPTGTANVRGVIWHRGDAAGFAPIGANAIDVQLYTSTQTRLIVDRLQRPGTYYYRITYFNPNGRLETHATEHSVTYA